MLKLERTEISRYSQSYEVSSLTFDICTIKQRLVTSEGKPTLYDDSSFLCQLSSTKFFLFHHLVGDLESWPLRKPHMNLGEVNFVNKTPLNRRFLHGSKPRDAYAPFFFPFMCRALG